MKLSPQFPLTLLLFLIACSSGGGPSGPDEDNGSVSGNVATYQGLAMTATGHLEPWTDWEFEFMAPDPGHHHYTLNVRVVNGSSVQVTVNPLDWQLEYGGSIRIDREGGFREPAIGLTNLAPGEQVSGWLTFQVPDGQPVTAVYWSPRFSITLKIPVSSIP